MLFSATILASHGKPDLLGPALGWLNGAQIVTPIILLTMANRMQRRAWPFLIFGPILLVSFLGLMFIPSTLVDHRLLRLRLASPRRSR